MAELVAEAGPGGSLRLPVQRSQVPLVLRRTPEAVYLVSGAAGPLGGDTLELRIEVRAGATLRLRTVATNDKPCADFPLKTGDDYDPAVLLDLDYWVLMPR